MDQKFEWGSADAEFSRGVAAFTTRRNAAGFQSFLKTIRGTSCERCRYRSLLDAEGYAGMPVIYDRRQRLIAALLRQRTYAGAIVLEILSRRPLDDLEVGTTALKQQGLDFTLGR